MLQMILESGPSKTLTYRKGQFHLWTLWTELLCKMKELPWQTEAWKEALKDPSTLKQRMSMTQFQSISKGIYQALQVIMVLMP